MSINKLLLDGIREKNLESVEILLENGADVDYRDQDGKTALMIAAEIGSGEIVEFLIKKGADVLAKDNNHKTAEDLTADAVVKKNLEKAALNALLLQSAQKNKAGAVKLFLKKGADANARDKNGNSAFDLATDADVKKILQGNAVNSAPGLAQPQRAVFSGAKRAHDAVSQTPAPVSQNSAQALSAIQQKELDESLIGAAIRGDANAVKSLLERGVDVNFQDDHGWTALMIASKNGHKKTVEMLLRHNPNVDLQNKDGWTALMHASFHGRAEIVQMLVEKNGIKGQIGMNALMMASIAGHMDIAKILIAKIEELDQDLKKKLEDASEKGCLDIVKILVEQDVNILGPNGRNALITAASSNKSEIIRILIAKGVNVNAAFYNGTTALRHASREGHTGIVRMLVVEYGADVHAKASGKTAYDIAANDEIKRILRAAAQENAQPAASQAVQAVQEVEQPMPLLVRIPVGEIQRNLRPEFNEDLVNAVIKGDVKSVRSLLAAGADVNTRSRTHARANQQRTVLMLACYYKHVDIVKILLDAGADIAAIDIYEKTALMIAANQNGNVEITRMLVVEYGADINAKDKNEKTAYDLASNKEIKAILENARKSSPVVVSNENGKAVLDLTSDADAGLSGSKRAKDAFSQEDDARSKRPHVARVSGATREELNASLLEKVQDQNAVNAVRHLLSQGADPDFANDGGPTCLMLAIILHDDDTIAKMLIAKMLDVNTEDQDKRTALMVAAEHGKAELVKLLLGKNADITARNKDGKTALDLASDENVRKILEKASEAQKLDQDDVEVAGFLARLSNSSSPSQGK